MDAEKKNQIKCFFFIKKTKARKFVQEIERKETEKPEKIVKKKLKKVVLTIIKFLSKTKSHSPMHKATLNSESPTRMRILK